MRNPVEIEDIEEMRRREGIDDVELREDIRGLKIGDCVKLTLLAAGKGAAGETLLVRITRIKDGVFHGRLTGRPTSTALAKLGPEVSVTFTATHIHSLPKGRPAPEA